MDTVAIRRDQIADIDHHDNVMMVTFALLGIPLLSSIPPTAEMMIDGKFNTLKGERQNGLGNVLGFPGLAFCLLPWALSVKGGIEWGPPAIAPPRSMATCLWRHRPSRQGHKG